MSASDWAHLDFDLIVAETDRALLFEFAELAGQIWVPLSVIADPDDYKRGDKNGTVSIKMWFAKKEGLCDD